MEKPTTPESIRHRASSYKDGAWKQYTQEELYWWVRLLSKRARHRTEEEKIKKDLLDAQAYLDMLGQYDRGSLFTEANDLLSTSRSKING